MGKTKTPSFVLTIEMEANNSVIRAIEDYLEMPKGFISSKKEKWQVLRVKIT